MTAGEAIKYLRKELGMTQVELAKAMNIYGTSISRWESGKTVPQVKMAKSILKVAEQNGASTQCIEQSKVALHNGHKEMVRVSDSHLFPVERESICALVDDSFFGIIVADADTNELLYANHRAEELFCKSFLPNRGVKCYEFTENFSAPCNGCRKAELNGAAFSDMIFELPVQKKTVHARGRFILWNGRKAHVEYITEVIDSPSPKIK